MADFILWLLLASLLVGAYAWLARARGWQDSPNIRSSHARVTPRGAGIVFALLIILAAGFSPTIRVMDSAVSGSIALGFGIALVGWWDDIKGLSARRRFLGYGLICAVALVWIGGFSSVRPDISWGAAVLLGAFCWIALQWLLNLYNFMDGINGLAALEAIFVLASIAAMSASSIYWATWSGLITATVAALLGFLFWNFPRAKVFMGDAGSAFLGFFLGILMIWSVLYGGPKPVVWLILLGVFIVDATYTLLVRIFTGQPWYSAHRSHAYQRLADRFGSHAPAVAVLMAIDVLWLLPLAWLVQSRAVPDVAGLTLAYLPLVVFCRKYGAGQLTSG